MQIKVILLVSILGTDSIFGYVDVNGDQTFESSSLPSNVSTDLIGSILWPNNRSLSSISTSLPGGSNQLLILTGLYEPQAQASKEWRVPGEITVQSLMELTTQVLQEQLSAC